MSRTFLREGTARTLAVADAAFPANQPTPPTTDYYTETSPLPAGIWRTEGAQTILVDIDQGASSTANTYNVLAWNRQQRKWFLVQAITPGANQVTSRTSIANWASDYCFVAVSGSTVAATILVPTAQNITL